MLTCKVESMTALCRQRHFEIMTKGCRCCWIKGLMSSFKVEGMAGLTKWKAAALPLESSRFTSRRRAYCKTLTKRPQKSLLTIEIFSFSEIERSSECPRKTDKM